MLTRFQIMQNALLQQPLRHCVMKLVVDHRSQSTTREVVCRAQALTFAQRQAPLILLQYFTPSPVMARSVWNTSALGAGSLLTLALPGGPSQRGFTPEPWFQVSPRSEKGVRMLSPKGKRAARGRP